MKRNFQSQEKRVSAFVIVEHFLAASQGSNNTNI